MLYYIGTREDKKAKNDCNHVLNIDPKNEDAYVLCGNTYEGKGDCDRAIGDYGQLIINPRHE